MTRGIVADVARAHGVDHFDDGHAITADDLDAAVALAGVTVRPGGALLVRTGQMHFLRQGDQVAVRQPVARAVDPVGRALHDHGIAAVAADTLVFEVASEEPDVLLPVHLLHLAGHGPAPGPAVGRSTTWRSTARRRRYEVLLCATPLPSPARWAGARRRRSSERAPSDVSERRP